ncbi:cytochrome C oxidase subunit IV family protein [Polycladomyces subterraneus]|uniref:Cytochrome C oxidase subunit IV family protein n=1 Tax=Polycladomyces subterraneus TaxID=1016997 RepID=A0ABT8IN01_9BACL|nr:cytochrome C oxidase subunit IV family protein [Polycladomyces subterraneus]MDN4593911.1 cytochrome C oxidase subunit IV family protein [Polycladomyces subterraneus]
MKSTNTNHTEMRTMLLSFVAMMVLSAVAFALVWLRMPPNMVVPVLFVLAFVQVILQLYSFMHLKEKKNNAFPILFISSGIFFGLVFAWYMWYTK